MRTKAVFTLTVVCCILFSAMISYCDDKSAQATPASPAASAPSNTPEKAAVAVVPEEKYDFKAVAEGVEVVHDFVIQNKGTADLEILAVRPG